MKRNRHGLSRDIPAAVKREVRRLSKFGCVNCRSGFYTYEHITPLFSEAKVHDPLCVCCLCGSCHDAVTRGQISKALIQKRYKDIQETEASKVEPPRGPMDFHDGSAELLIGGLSYEPAVNTVLRYYGRDLIKVTPGQGGNPGAISAVFLDDQGQEILRLDENEWIGFTTGWDLEVVGARLKVSQKLGKASLVMRLDPPGRVVVEWLDMRLPDAHVLVTEEAYLVGRYLCPLETPNGMMFGIGVASQIDQLVWHHASIAIRRSRPNGCAIDISDPVEVRERYSRSPAGTELATPDQNFTMKSGFGVSMVRSGITIAMGCDGFDLFGTAVGFRSLTEARGAMKKNATELMRYIAQGRLEQSR